MRPYIYATSPVEGVSNFTLPSNTNRQIHHVSVERTTSKEITPKSIQQKKLMFSPSKQSPSSPFYSNPTATIGDLISGHQRIKIISTADKVNAWYADFNLNLTDNDIDACVDDLKENLQEHLERTVVK